jgi:hypothetical protein
MKAGARHVLGLLSEVDNAQRDAPTERRLHEDLRERMRARVRCCMRSVQLRRTEGDEQVDDLQVEQVRGWAAQHDQVLSLERCQGAAMFRRVMNCRGDTLHTRQADAMTVTHISQASQQNDGNSLSYVW